MRTRHPSQSKLRRNIPLLIATEFFAELRFYFPVGVLIFESLTGSYASAMSVFAVANLFHAFFEIPTGVLSDRWGRRGTLFIGAVGEVVAIACYAMAFFSALPYVWLYAGSGCYGFANALFSGNNQALVYETLGRYRKAKETAKILGRISAAGQAGMGLAGALAVLALWAGISYRSLLLLSLISLSITVLLSFLMIEPLNRFVEEGGSWRHCKKAFRLILKNKRLRLYAIASMIQRGGGQASYYFTPGFIGSVWPVWLVPFYRVGQHMIGAISFWFSGALIRKFSAILVLQVGALAANVVSVIALVMGNVFSPFLLMITQIAYGSGTTADQTVQQENFSDEQRATMGSLIALGGAIITGIVSVVTGWISDLSTPAFAMGIMIVGRAAIVQTLYMQIYRRHR